MNTTDTVNRRFELFNFNQADWDTFGGCEDIAPKVGYINIDQDDTPDGWGEGEMAIVLDGKTVSAYALCIDNEDELHIWTRQEFISPEVAEKAANRLGTSFATDFDFSEFQIMGFNVWEELETGEEFKFDK
mgnify:CR=1 FL=1